MNRKITRALISVSDKTGLVEFAKTLSKHGVELLSTGGSAKTLRDAGLQVTDVGGYTGFPEMLDGRVKTLHPKVHGGILANRLLPAHMSAVEGAKIPLIDLVVVNLYPFRETVAKPNCSLEDAIENIDIGGPTMVRAAAKNWEGVAIVVDAGDYEYLSAEMNDNAGALSRKTRFALAKKAFSHTASYDAAISNYLTCRELDGEVRAYPDVLTLQWHKAQDMRYGENPHQSAAFYRDETPAKGTLARYTQLQGKELSYNNVADADAAWECVRSFDETCCVIVKHANPCGVALGANALEAYQRAFATDPTSAFGGIIAFNTAVDAQTLEAVSKQFVEVLIAPDYSADALELAAKKANVRVLKVAIEKLSTSANALELKRVGGGVLAQSADTHQLDASALKVVTAKAPDRTQLRDMQFVWKVAQFVKSNAIVFAKDGQTLGIGAGQMSRLDSARIAKIKAEAAGLTLQGSVAASDAFFPFRDGLDVLADAGAIAVIQPGGSMRDQEVIDAANERGVAMVTTGVRHFRH
ncbi:MAG: bifunctional phosphoribosylaminoimidazolecarboxamide formyltransferase/IMP cyclohydrolase PurH [Betaproteobacteria bacterium]|nr:MAG: bifunctional phosphoribosylaminoimidazolecarboxamide formyltransferase/IMP cyclohydrolase PurH [Betaproteobacteria bacterium]